MDGVREAGGRGPTHVRVMFRKKWGSRGRQLIGLVAWIVNVTLTL